MIRLVTHMAITRERCLMRPTPRSELATNIANISRAVEFNQPSGFRIASILRIDASRLRFRTSISADSRIRLDDCNLAATVRTAHAPLRQGYKSRRHDMSSDKLRRQIAYEAA